MTVCTRLPWANSSARKTEQRAADILLEAHICPTCEVVLVESPVHLQKLIASDSWLKH
jgi:hypothetical protein